MLSVERSLSRAWSGGEGSEGPGGGGKRYKEKAKLFPRHFLHLHYVGDFEVIFPSMCKERAVGAEEIFTALYMLKQ